MNALNYFLADLPSEARPTSELLSEACLSLRRNRARYLADRSTAQMIKLITKVAQEWMMDDNPIRVETLRNGPTQTGFSVEVLRQGLDDFFGGITESSLVGLIEQDLGHVDRLDAMVSNANEASRLCAAMARGPELLGHITGGVLPNPTFTSILLGLLIRSAQFVKCAQGTSFLPRMFAHSIYQADPKLGACLEIAEWKGGDAALEETWFNHLDCLTATGSSETIATLRQRIPGTLKLVGHGHQVSVGYVASEMLEPHLTRDIIQCVALDVTIWDQLGCLSPQIIYVELDGTISPTMFAELLARELSVHEVRMPRAPLDVSTAAKIASYRNFYEIRSTYGESKIWCSQGSTAWTVVFDPSSDFQPSCQHRFIFVKPIANLTQLLMNLDAVVHQVSTVGIAVPSSKTNNVAGIIARWGATRVCPLGQMQRPPLTWRHDGHPPLGELVTWCNLEF